jgi:Fe-S cluster assembly scaffold protein SufB
MQNLEITKHQNTAQEMPPRRYEKPIWKRLALPEHMFPLGSNRVEEAVTVKGEGVHISDLKDLNSAYFTLDAFTKNLGDVFTSYVTEEAGHGKLIRSDARTFEAPQVEIVYGLDSEKSVLADHTYILVEEGAKLTVVLDYKSASENLIAPEQHYGLTRVHVKRGGMLRLVKLQRLADHANHFDQVMSVVEEGATLELVDVQFGAKTKAVAYETHLMGRQAQANLNSMYFGDSGSQLDLSFTMKHFGAQSHSTILSKGALAGDSKKTFRGNLIFETGSAQSIGREKETVMLLDEKVKSDSIPALLCSEDDVIGEHAASVGQLDEEKIFYLMSRGMSLDAAKKLVIKASFEEILTTLGDEKLKAEIENFLDRRLDDGI